MEMNLVAVGLTVACDCEVIRRDSVDDCFILELFRCVECVHSLSRKEKPSWVMFMVVVE